LSIRKTDEKYPNAAHIVPAMGYGEEQIRELEETINATPADVVVEGTPIQLDRIIKVNKPIANVTYELEEVDPGVIEEMVTAVVAGI
jgi:predicted GTPase